MLKSTISLICSLAFSLCHIHAQPNQWQQLPGPFGGSINCATQLNSTWYIGTGSGVFSSSNEGESWQRLNWTPQSQIVTSILLQPDETIVATTTVDLTEYSTDYWLGLIYRSTDQGQSWSVDTIKSDFSYGPNNIKIFRQRGALFAWDSNLLMRSDDNGNTWEDVMGPNLNFEYFDFNDSLIIGDDGFSEGQYTRDGGNTWLPITAPAGAVFGSYTLGIGNTIFYFDSFDPSYRTTNFGNSWQSLGTPFGYAEIAACKMLPGGKLAALVSYPFADEMIYTSNNDGLNWQKYDGSPAALPLDVVANGNMLGVATANGFYKNYNNGNFLNPSNTGITASDIKSQLLHKGQFLAGSADGLWRSFDNGVNWFSTFPQSQLVGTKDVQAKGDTLCAITDGNFFYSIDNGDSWVNPYVSGGAPWGVPFDEPYHFAYDGDHLLVSGSDLYTSADFGENWDTYTDYPRSSGVVVAEGKYFAIAFWDGILRSNDQGTTWEVVKDAILGEGRMYYIHEKVFACVEHGLARSSNLGNSWTIPSGIPTHGTFNYPLPVTAMAANDTVIFAGVNYAGIYQSKDDGASWTLFSADMPNLRFNDLVLENGVLYAACTGGGIWKYSLKSSGTHSPVAEQSLFIWPNPAGEQGIQIPCSGDSESGAQITVYDALGRLVFSQRTQCTDNKVQLSLGDLPPGIYRLVETTAEQVLVGSFVRN